MSLFCLVFLVNSVALMCIVCVCVCIVCACVLPLTRSMPGSEVRTTELLSHSLMWFTTQMHAPPTKVKSRQTVFPLKAPVPLFALMSKKLQQGLLPSCWRVLLAKTIPKVFFFFGASMHWIEKTFPNIVFNTVFVCGHFLQAHLCVGGGRGAGGFQRWSFRVTLKGKKNGRAE